MSSQPINHSPDLKRLRDEGYDIEVRAGHLLVKDVPYVNSKQDIAYGTLVSPLQLNGDVAVPPESHVIFFAGDFPCHKNGSEIGQIRHQSTRSEILPGLTIDHSFSNKPPNGYANFYDKVTTYVDILSGPAQAIDPTVSAKTFPVIQTVEDDSVFNYEDTASSRAGITMISQKLELDRIGIVGLGGTGSYILDVVAKTLVKEIHLFDGDVFSSHNAFRSPGAASLDELRSKPKKVEFFREKYSRLHRNIIAHGIYIDASNIERLRDMKFVFLCMDGNEAKKVIVEQLEEFNIPFVDVGMGVDEESGSLGGILRVTTSTPEKRDHVRGKGRISFADGAIDDDYSRNIQVADLNMLNAALAVIKWKKLCGFYQDQEHDHNSTYSIDINLLTSEDKP